jgi:hypothetical protein
MAHWFLSPYPLTKAYAIILLIRIEVFLSISYLIWGWDYNLLE